MHSFSVRIIHLIVVAIMFSAIALLPNDVHADTCMEWDVSIGQPGLSGPVTSMLVMPNDDVIVSGNFTLAGDVEVGFIARWDGTAWHALGDGLNSIALALSLMPNGDLIAAGSFTQAGDRPANRIARWDGSSWHPLGDGLNNTVRALTIMPDGDLIAGGSFTAAGDADAHQIARWDGQDWHPLGEGVDGQAVRDMELLDASLHVAKRFVDSQGQIQASIRVWDGQSWSTLPSPGPLERVTALKTFDNGSGPMLYATGALISLSDTGVYMPWTARWDGRQWLPSGTAIHGYITELTIVDDGSEAHLYAAVHNNFLNPTALVPRQIMRWDGTRRSTKTDQVIRAFAGTGPGQKPAIYIGGSFTEVDGQSVGRIAQWNNCEPTFTTRHVPSQYATIQSAIDAADDGDHVHVAPGTYHEAIDYQGKRLTIASEQDAENTIIDATGLGTSAVTVEDVEAGVLQGFTITGGIGQLLFQDDPETRMGGGIFVIESELTVLDCRIIDNGSEETYTGGGIGVATDTKLIVGNSRVQGNVANAAGGGAGVFSGLSSYPAYVYFYDCEFLDNTAAQGGGINVNNHGRVILDRCLIKDNSTTQWDFWSPLGGGVLGLNQNEAFTVIHNCDVVGNTAERGGGAQGRLNVYHARISSNIAEDFGGGVVASSDSRINSVHFCDNTPNHISGNNWTDEGGNTFHDVCDPTPGDLNGDGVVDVSDLLILLANWGPCPLDGSCPADLDGDGVVDVADLLILLANWSN